MNELEVQEMKHTLAGIAELLWAYVADLEAQGFSREEALRLAIGWQTALIQQGRD